MKFHSSIKNRLLIFSAITILIPSMFIYPVMIISQQNKITSQVYQNNINITNLLTDKINLVFNHINSMSNLLFLDAQISEILASDYTSYNTLQYDLDQNTILALCDKYNATLDNIEFEYTFLSQNGRIYGNANYNNKVSLMKPFASKWYQVLLNNPWHIIWIKDKDLDGLLSHSTSSYIYAMRSMKDLSTFEDLGVLIIGFSETDIVKMFGGSITNNQNLYIIDGNGNLITCVDNLSLSLNIAELYPLTLSFSDAQTIYNNNTPYILSYSTSTNTNWKIILIEDFETRLSQYDNLTNILIYSIILSLISSGVFIYIIMKQIIHPISNLQNKMKLVQDGNLKERIQYTTDDEIGKLSLQFNNMLDNIDELMSTIIAEQTAKKTAEIQALYSQINPHLIYNTLTTVRYLVGTQNSGQADTVVVALMRLLKTSLSDQNQTYTLKQELEIVKNYIYIQQFSFEDKIQITYNIDENLLDCFILKVSIQPIIENAIFHGLKPLETQKKLDIFITSKDEILYIRIKDNGVGTNKQMNFTNSRMTFDKNIGLQNIHSRIVLHYGDNYGVKFHSSQGKGTCVLLTVPLEYMTERIDVDEYFNC